MQLHDAARARALRPRRAPTRSASSPRSRSSATRRSPYDPAVPRAPGRESGARGARAPPRRGLPRGQRHADLRRALHRELQRPRRRPPAAACAGSWSRSRVPAVTWCAAPFWRGALAGPPAARAHDGRARWCSARRTAFVVSVAGTLAETRHLYVDSAAMIVFLILLGRTLEQRARARAAGAVERLAALAPGEGVAAPRGRARARSPRASSAAAIGRWCRRARPCRPTGASLAARARSTRRSSPARRSRCCAAGRRRDGRNAQPRGRARGRGDRRRPATGTLARLGALLERAAAEKPAIQRLADRIAGLLRARPSSSSPSPPRSAGRSPAPIPSRSRCAPRRC